jgi:hypothetical protein
MSSLHELLDNLKQSEVDLYQDVEYFQSYLQEKGDTECLVNASLQEKKELIRIIAGRMSQTGPQVNLTFNSVNENYGRIRCSRHGEAQEKSGPSKYERISKGCKCPFGVTLKFSSGQFDMKNEHNMMCKQKGRDSSISAKTAQNLTSPATKKRAIQTLSDLKRQDLGLKTSQLMKQCT